MTARANILLVDDEKQVRDELSGLLSDWEFAVDTAVDGMEALELIKKNDYTIHLADVKMPRMDGLDLLKVTRTLKPQAYFIIFTGHGDEQIAINCLNNGAYHYLKKPVEAEELKIAIERCLNFQKLVADVKTLEGVMLTAANLEDQVINPAAVIVMTSEMLIYQYDGNEALVNRLKDILHEARRIIDHVKQIKTVKEVKVFYSVFGPMLDVFYHDYKKKLKE